jgi:hypothetical protein
MDITISLRNKILLICSIASAVFFSTLMLLDHFNIETSLIASIREALLIPFFLMQISLPFVLLRFIRKSQMENRNLLMYAAVISILIILIILLKIFIFY